MNGPAIEAAFMLDVPGDTGSLSKGTAKLVLLALAGHASWEDGKCWPSIERLSALTGQGERTVRRALDHLAEQKLIVRKKRATWTEAAVWKMGAWYVPQTPAALRAARLAKSNGQTGRRARPDWPPNRVQHGVNNGFASQGDPENRQRGDGPAPLPTLDQVLRDREKADAARDDIERAITAKRKAAGGKR